MVIYHCFYGKLIKPSRQTDDYSGIRHNKEHRRSYFWSSTRHTCDCNSMPSIQTYDRLTNKTTHVIPPLPPFLFCIPPSNKQSMTPFYLLLLWPISLLFVYAGQTWLLLQESKDKEQVKPAWENSMWHKRIKTFYDHFLAVSQPKRPALTRCNTSDYPLDGSYLQTHCNNNRDSTKV